MSNRGRRATGHIIRHLWMTVNIRRKKTINFTHGPIRLLMILSVNLNKYPFRGLMVVYLYYPAKKVPYATIRLMSVRPIPSIQRIAVSWV